MAADQCPCGTEAQTGAPPVLTVTYQLLSDAFLSLIPILGPVIAWIQGQVLDTGEMCAHQPVRPADFSLPGDLDPTKAASKAGDWLYYYLWYDNCQCTDCPSTPPTPDAQGCTTYNWRDLPFEYNGVSNCWEYHEAVDYGTWQISSDGGATWEFDKAGYRIDVYWAREEEGQCGLFLDDSLFQWSDHAYATTNTYHPAADTMYVCPVGAQTPSPYVAPTDPSGGEPADGDAACTDPCTTLDRLTERIIQLQSAVSAIARAVFANEYTYTFPQTGQSITGGILPSLATVLPALATAIQPASYTASYHGAVTGTEAIITNARGVMVDVVTDDPSLGHYDSTPMIRINHNQQPLLGIVTFESGSGITHWEHIRIDGQTVLSPIPDVQQIHVWTAQGVELDVWLLAPTLT